MRRLSLGLALVALATPCNAQPPLTAQADRSSVDTLAAAVGAQVRAALAEHAGGDLAIDASIELPPQAPRAGALLDALIEPWLAVLIGEPRWRAHARVEHDADAAQTARRAALQGFEALVSVTVRAQGNFLVIDGSVWRTELGRWSDRLAYRPLRLATIFARMRLDVELRRYVGALPRLDEQSVVARAGELPAGGYVAMAAADVDMDGRTELVMVRAADVTVLRVSPARGALRIEHVARLDFPSGTPTAPSRRRRVVASARGDGDGVVLRTSEHARTFRLGWQEDHPELAPAQSSCAQDLFPMGDACARLVEGRDFFEPRVLERGVEHETPGSFYTRVARPIRTAEGGTVLYEAIVTPHGRLAARAGDRPIGAAGYGASLALADLDDDGSPELLTSSARNVGAGDQLALLRILPRGALHVVWRSPELEGSVLVTCAADVDDDGVEEMLAIEEPAGTGARARLWVLR